MFEVANMNIAATRMASTHTARVSMPRIEQHTANRTPLTGGARP